MRETDDTIQVLTDDWEDYELLDSGNRQKLERFGQYVLARSEPRAWWGPSLSDEWGKAVASYRPTRPQDEERGQWVMHQPVPEEWHLRFEGLTLLAKFTPMSRHVGVFPEHSRHWRWVGEQGRRRAHGSFHVLNLFGYTGVASLMAAAAGAQVTHVDASRVTIAWARENQQLSGLENAPIRWILDDALKFVGREARRQRRYDAIILDPPAFGRGPKGEVWKIDRDLSVLLDACRKVLSDDPAFILLTMYSIDASSIIIGNLLQELMRGFGGSVTIGELALRPKSHDRRLPMSIFGRWEKG